jgi:hypothetical protein
MWVLAIVTKTVDLQAIDVGSAHRCLASVSFEVRNFFKAGSQTSEMPRRCRACKMPSQIWGPVILDIADHEPKSAFRVAGTN